MGCKILNLFCPVPRELAESLTRATQPRLMSPGGSEQDPTLPSGEPTIRATGFRASAAGELFIRGAIKGGVESNAAKVVGQFPRMRCGGNLKISFREIDLQPLHQLIPPHPLAGVCVECLVGKQNKPTLFKVTEPSSVPYRSRYSGESRPSA